ncbi:MAG: hypothetical protein NTW38_09065 [Candidatus Aminicenantes bacterium]|nr:hypothetical protein [Candidatus Aminicenantes bacterium]
MRNNNGIDAGKASSMKIPWVGLLIAVLLLPGIAPAVEKKSGNKLTLTLKNGSIVEGELLTVMEDRLILFDSNSSTDANIWIGEVARIQVQKKSKFLPGLGLGILIGGATGAVLGLFSGNDETGWIRFTAGQKAFGGALGFGLLAGAVGGIIGAIAGIDESIDLGSLPPPALDQVLTKLKYYARVSGKITPTVKIVPAPITAEGSKPAEKEAKSTFSEKSGLESNQTIPLGKYCRFHLSLGLGYFQSFGISQLENIIRDIGFAGKRTNSSFFESYTIEYPSVKQDPILLDLLVEYSLSRKFALGLVYAPLGEHTISGWRTIPNKDYRFDYFPETYFVGSYNGRMVFLTASYFPIPDAFLKKTSLKLTAGFGYGKLEMDYYGSEHEYIDQNPGLYSTIDKKNFSKSSAGALLSAELIFLFNPHWSLGINADYKYVPINCGGFVIDCPYYYYDASPSSGGSLIFDALHINIPDRTYNLGGLGVGVHFSYHF